MPNVYKVQDEDSDGNVYLYASDAKIVAFDSKNATNLTAGNAQDAIEAVNNKAEGKADMHTLSTTIYASAFDGATAPYKQTIKVSGILATDTPDIGVVLDDVVATALKQKDSFGSISRITTGNGSITVWCYEDKPSVDLPIQIRIIR
jgi:type I restriction-modification system DNA methylase subunit